MKGILNGPQVAVSLISNLVCEYPNLKNNHLFHATLAEFHTRGGNVEKAREHLSVASRLTENSTEKELIQRKMSKIVA